MKNNVTGITSRFLPFFIICCIFMLSGCLNATTNIPYTSSAPPEKLCTLIIASTLTVTKFDGEDVKWTTNFTDYWSSVQIPEGTHTFVADYMRTVQGGWQQEREMTFTGNFIAGRPIA